MMNRSKLEAMSDKELLAWTAFYYWLANDLGKKFLEPILQENLSDELFTFITSQEIKDTVDEFLEGSIEV